VIRISLTNEQRNLEPIGSAFCEHYRTEAKFFIERSIPLGKRLGTGARHLVVQYGESYTGRDDLAVTATGQREFAIIISNDWSNEKLLIFYRLRPRTRMSPIRRGRCQHASTEGQCCLNLRTPRENRWRGRGGLLPCR
jgi:hypothetical protein